MTNITAKIFTLHEEDVLQQIHETVEAEEALLEAKMTDAEKRKMKSLQSPFIQSLMAEAEARLDSNQDPNRKSKVKSSKELSAHREKMRQKYIVSNMLENNGTIN